MNTSEIKKEHPKRAFHSSQNSVCSVSTASSLGFNKYDGESIPLDFEVPMLGPAHLAEIQKLNGYNAGEAERHFDHMAQNYEGIYVRLGYPDPKKVAEQVQKYAKKKGLKQDNVRILDVACGTGLVGQELARRGFKNVVGLDISEGMLAQARQKGVYTELLQHDINEFEEFPPRLNNAFDFVVGAGIVNNNHQDKRLFETMMRGCKKDGNIVFASRFSYIGTYWYDDCLETLNQEFRLKLLHQEDFFKYDRIMSSVGRFSRTPCRVFVYENLMDVQATGIRRQILKNMRQAFLKVFYKGQKHQK